MQINQFFLLKNYLKNLNFISKLSTFEDAQDGKFKNALPKCQGYLILFCNPKRLQQIILNRILLDLNFKIDTEIERRKMKEYNLINFR